jgi:hypothetical protein
MVVDAAKSDIKTFTYTFRKKKDGNHILKSISLYVVKTINLLDLQICIGDYVLLNTETGHYGLGSGVVKNLTEHSVTIKLDEQLTVCY